MAAGSEGKRLAQQELPEVAELLTPLQRDATDWAAVYRTYGELPPGERHVLDLLVGRHDPKQAARKLGVSWNTVRNQICSLKTKFAADSVQELVLSVTIALYEEARRSEVRKPK